MQTGTWKWQDKFCYNSSESLRLPPAKLQSYPQRMPPGVINLKLHVKKHVSLYTFGTIVGNGKQQFNTDVDAVVFVT